MIMFSNTGADPGVVLGTVTLDDLDDLVALECRCFEHPWTRSALSGEIGRSTNIAARDAQRRLLGYCFYLEAALEVQILNIAVAPEARRRGIALAMLDELVRSARQRGLAEILLEVRVSNLNAISLYEKIGFSRLSLRRRYYADGEDALIMHRRTEGL